MKLQKAKTFGGASSMVESGVTWTQGSHGSWLGRFNAHDMLEWETGPWSSEPDVIAWRARDLLVMMARAVDGRWLAVFGRKRIDLENLAHVELLPYTVIPEDDLQSWRELDASHVFGDEVEDPTLMTCRMIIVNPWQSHAPSEPPGPAPGSATYLKADAVMKVVSRAVRALLVRPEIGPRSQMFDILRTDGIDPYLIQDVVACEVDIDLVNSSAHHAVFRHWSNTFVVYERYGHLHATTPVATADELEVVLAQGCRLGVQGDTRPAELARKVRGSTRDWLEQEGLVRVGDDKIIRLGVAGEEAIMRLEEALR